MNHEAREVLKAHEEGGGTPDLEEMTRRVIGVAIRVHRTVGPGLLEHVYEDCMGFELSRSGLRYERQVELPLIYEGIRLDRAYKADIVIAESVIVEIKIH